MYELDMVNVLELIVEPFVDSVFYHTLIPPLATVKNLPLRERFERLLLLEKRRLFEFFRRLNERLIVLRF